MVRDVPRGHGAEWRGLGPTQGRVGGTSLPVLLVGFRATGRYCFNNDTNHLGGGLI